MHLQQESERPLEAAGSHHAQWRLDVTSAATFALNSEWLRQLHLAAQHPSGNGNGNAAEPAAVETAVRHLSWAISLLAQAWNSVTPRAPLQASAAELAAVLSACAPELASHTQLWLRAFELASAAVGRPVNAAAPAGQLAELQLSDVLSPHVGEKVRLDPETGWWYNLIANIKTRQIANLRDLTLL